MYHVSRYTILHLRLGMTVISFSSRTVTDVSDIDISFPVTVSLCPDGLGICGRNIQR